MYLTTYKINKTLSQNYNTLLDTDDDVTYYKTTIKINNPLPLENLSDKAKQHIANVEHYIHQAFLFLENYTQTYEKQYYTFKIPKRSGGLRTINAPNTQFKNILTTVKDIFENKIKCLSHNAAYAYTKNRSVLDAIKIHQKNDSNWYLKIDLTDFFTNCTPELIFKQLMQLYPFYYINNTTQEFLKAIIQTCSLNNGLPQGTPISPFLTNLIMVPYDYEIHKYLKRGTGNHYVYTRYADDILISSKSKFNWSELQNQLQKILQPFQIKRQKTRYGSKAGSNWNLGLMLNKDNNITVGSNRKRTINAMLNNFIRDYLNNNKWSKEDTYSLQGQLSWLKQIEPEYYEHITLKYENKYAIPNYLELIKTILN